MICYWLSLKLHIAHLHRNSSESRVQHPDLHNVLHFTTIIGYAQVCKPYRDTNGFQVMRIFHVSHPARRCKQCFGGHTATIDTCATNIMPLNDSNFETLQAKHRVSQLTSRLHTICLLILVHHQTAVKLLTLSIACIAAPWPPTPAPTMTRS